MGILISFTPWMVFFAFFYSQHLLLAGVAPLIIYAIFKISKKLSFKLLDYASCAFFIILLLSFAFISLKIMTVYMTFISNGFLAIVILVTILIKAPFSSSYAKEMVPKEKWNSPHFIKINIIISYIWFFYFALCAILGIFSHQSAVETQIVEITALIIAIYLTRKFPSWYRQKFINNSI